MKLKIRHRYREIFIENYDSSNRMHTYVYNGQRIRADLNSELQNNVLKVPYNLEVLQHMVLRIPQNSRSSVSGRSACADYAERSVK